MAGKKESYRIGTGATSLLMVLVILCLTMLSALCYSSASSEKRPRERVSSVQHEVYAAQNTAQRTIAELDAIIASCAGLEGDSYLDAISQKIADAGMTAELDGDEITFSVPANDNLCLNVALTVNQPGEQTRYTITRYATETINQDDADFDDEPFDLMK
ncbi:MAG: hypothetical protein Q4C54_01125 [Clostridia bacterium]|nr:hypothetical protein [Clostridia bacterium]